MKTIKRLAIAAALSSITFAASAMTPIADSELSQVSGQDGVSIAANLNVNIGSFVYGTKNGAEGGGNVAFNDINITGDIAATLDILKASSFYSVSTGGVISGEAITVLGLVVPSGAVQGAIATAAAATGATPASIAAAAVAAGSTNPAADIATVQSLAAFWPGTDVVRIAVPNLATTKLLNVTVGSITMGVNGVQPTGTAPSFGSFAMNNINLAGTTAYIWAH